MPRLAAVCSAVYADNGRCDPESHIVGGATARSGSMAGERIDIFCIRERNMGETAAGPVAGVVAGDAAKYSAVSRIGDDQAYTSDEATSIETS